jgi:predicted dehydrogenase
MRFALLGSHPDGLEMACALVEVGGHQLVAYTGQAVGDAYLRRWGPQVKRVGDLEEVLADPTVEAVIVAGSPANRAAQLRRALQSERPVLCVHPAADRPETAYEAAMIQGDTKGVLLPLLPDALHPAVGRLVELLRDPEGPVGELRLIEVERWSADAVLLDANVAGHEPSLPGWDVLRRLGGEIVEVSAFAAGEEVPADAPLLLAGRFEKGGLFQVSLQPNQERAFYRLTAAGSRGRAQLLCPLGWPGPAFLSWKGAAGETCEEAWETWDPWPALVKVFDRAVARQGTSRKGAKAQSTSTGEARERPSWQDAVRALELDDAARRSAERRRTSAMEYQEASEEVGFKGTMTLVGCGLLWVIFLLLVLSIWVPKLGWAILPVLVLFLALQMLRWVVPRDRPPGADGGSANRR